MLLSYDPSNCELAQLYSVLRSKSQSAIHHGTLFLFETPIQAHRRFLRKFFSGDEFLGLSFTQISCEWKSIPESKEKPLDVFKRKIAIKFLAKFSLVSHSQGLCSRVYAKKEKQNDGIPVQLQTLFCKRKILFSMDKQPNSQCY